MPQNVSVVHLHEVLQGLSIQDITVEMTALIRSGAIPVGSKLPPVRELAEALGMSPASISSVWNTLKRNNLVTGSGRNGTWVSGNDPSPRPERFESVGNFGSHVKVDLTYASPDIELLPNLEQAMLAGLKADELNSYHRQHITKELCAAVQSNWPYKPQSLIATNGGYDALQAVINALIQPGTWVVVEEPTSARLLDILERIGARVLSVDYEPQGLDVNQLSQHLENHKVSALIYQPRSHAVCGHSTTFERLEQLLPFAEHIPLIIEDDGIGPISSKPVYSFGEYFPDKVVHIRSYSKSLGPDLRLAILSASNNAADKIQAYRNFGASWTSRILQNAGAYLLTDENWEKNIELARSIYLQRHNNFTQALDRNSIKWAGESGFSVWIPVPNEQFALVTLAVHGYAVFHGARFMNQPGQPHIRVAISCLKEQDIEPLVQAIKLCFDIR